MTKLYMLAPLTGLETFTDMSKAVNEAVRLTEEMGKQAGGFVVFEVVEIGRAEYARPLWISAREQEHVPAGMATFGAVTPPSAYSDDDVPF